MLYGRAETNIFANSSDDLKTTDELPLIISKKNN